MLRERFKFLFQELVCCFSLKTCDIKMGSGRESQPTHTGLVLPNEFVESCQTDKTFLDRPSTDRKGATLQPKQSSEQTVGGTKERVENIRQQLQKQTLHILIWHAERYRVRKQMAVLSDCGVAM